MISPKRLGQAGMVGGEKETLKSVTKEPGPQGIANHRDQERTAFPDRKVLS